MSYNSFTAKNQPDVFMALDVDLVEHGIGAFDAGEVSFHLHGYVARQHGQQKPFLHLIMRETDHQKPTAHFRPHQNTNAN
jgi:hypothetical protein